MFEWNGVKMDSFMVANRKSDMIGNIIAIVGIILASVGVSKTLSSSHYITSDEAISLGTYAKHKENK